MITEVGSKTGYKRQKRGEQGRAQAWGAAGRSSEAVRRGVCVTEGVRGTEGDTVSKQSDTEGRTLCDFRYRKP